MNERQAPLGLSVPVAVEQAVRAAYAQTPRAYHSFAHVLEVLGHFTRVRELVQGAQNRDAVALAILFHDAVYVAGRPDNEASSAELAKTLLRDTPFAPCIARVEQLIVLTARHGSLSPSDVDHDAALFLDCDMAILGAAPSAYAAYEQAIAQEYAHVPKVAYRAGRSMFLRKLLASPRIYLSDFFRDEREATARANLEQALNALSS